MSLNIVSPGRAVVVDDDRVNLYYTGRLLRGAGYEVVSTESYLQALKALSQNVDAILVADIRISRSSGITLAHLARGRYPAIKILLMTAYREEELNAADAGYPVLRVPFSGRSLLNSVRRLTLDTI